MRDATHQAHQYWLLVVTRPQKRPSTPPATVAHHAAASNEPLFPARCSSRRGHKTGGSRSIRSISRRFYGEASARTVYIPVRLPGACATGPDSKPEPGQAEPSSGSPGRSTPRLFRSLVFRSFLIGNLALLPSAGPEPVRQAAPPHPAMHAHSFGGEEGKKGSKNKRSFAVRGAAASPETGVSPFPFWWGASRQTT